MTFIRELMEWASTNPGDFGLRVTCGAMVLVILIEALRHGLLGHR